MLSLSVALALVATASACGGPGSGRSTLPIADRSVTDDTFSEVRRGYLLLAPDDPARAAVRDRLVAYLARGSDALISAGGYDDAVARLAELTELLLPVDFEPGRSLPPELGPLAHFVAERGATRGDEARVLAALLILTHIDAGEAEHASEYDVAAVWGHDARLGGDRSIFDLLDGAGALLGIWEEHARLSPAPAVLDRLATLHIELRDRFTSHAEERGFEPPRTMADLEAMGFLRGVLERTPLEVAAVYLRVGDLETARARVAAMGDASGTEWRVRRALEDAAREGSEGQEALLEVALAFAEARPDVATALCRQGARRFPAAAEFRLCLARLVQLSSPSEATAWYADAVTLAPDDEDVYEEALSYLAALFDDDVLSSFAAEGEIREVRAALRDATRILEERNRRFPTSPAGSVTDARLHYELGRAELHAGNVDVARRELEASLALTRDRETLSELALLAVRTGDAPRAIELYREALERVTDQSPAGRLERAAILEALGDAERTAGLATAPATYRQALSAFEGLFDVPDVSPGDLARFHARVGLLCRRLGDRERSDTELRLAMTLSPSDPGLFSEVLAHLVIDAPDAALAAEAFHRARVGSPLAPEWKVYFALWAQLTAERAGEAPVDEVLDVLAEHAAQTGWHARLAALGAGTASYEEVLSGAETAGQRCEAHFYAGARALARGDRAAADAAFHAALETGMVGFFEYGMAVELLAMN